MEMNLDLVTFTEPPEIYKIISKNLGCSLHWIKNRECVSVSRVDINCCEVWCPKQFLLSCLSMRCTKNPWWCFLDHLYCILLVKSCVCQPDFLKHHIQNQMMVMRWQTIPNRLRKEWSWLQQCRLENPVPARRSLQHMPVKTLSQVIYTFETMSQIIHIPTVHQILCILTRKSLSRTETIISTA